MTHINDFLSNSWTITIGGGLIVTLVAYYFFGIGKSKYNISSGGGRGGDAKTTGPNSSAIGGMGGGGGPGGKGGDGGSAEAVGPNSFAMGGEGGEAGQLDRGGRGGRSPMEVLGIENTQFPDGTYLWDYGRGGNGADPVAQDTQTRRFEQNERNYRDPKNSNK